MEHQTLGQWFICPIGPATDCEFILDLQIFNFTFTFTLNFINAIFKTFHEYLTYAILCTFYYCDFWLMRFYVLFISSLRWICLMRFLANVTFSRSQKSLIPFGSGWNWMVALVKLGRSEGVIPFAKTILLECVACLDIFCSCNLQ